MIKKIVFISFFLMLLFGINEARATTEESLSWPDFNCGRHGFHKDKYCTWDNYYFSGGPYENYQADFTISGHRHGSSVISGSICLVLSDGSQGPCGTFYGEGDQLGEEYGDVHPFSNIYKTGHLEVNNASGAYHVAISAYVEDAEVRISGNGYAWTVETPPPPSPPPPVSQVNLNFIVKK